MRPRFEIRNSKFHNRTGPSSQFREDRNPASDGNRPGGEYRRTRQTAKRKLQVSESF
jgi:hypothetical protein